MIQCPCSSFYPHILHTLTSLRASRIHAHIPIRAIPKTANRRTISAHIPSLVMDAATSAWQQITSCHSANLTPNGPLRHSMVVPRPTDSPLGLSRMSTTSRPGSGLDVHTTPGAPLHFSATRCIYRLFYVSAHNNSRPDPDCSGVIIPLAWSRLSPGLCNYPSVSSIPLCFSGHTSSPTTYPSCPWPFDFAVSSSILVFISHSVQFPPVSAIVVDSSRGTYAHTPPARRRDTGTESQSHSGITRSNIHGQAFCFNICRIVDPFNSPYHSNTFHHANLVTTSLVAPGLFTSSLLYCWSHRHLQTYHKTYKNMLAVTFYPSPIFLPSLLPLTFFRPILRPPTPPPCSQVG